MADAADISAYDRARAEVPKAIAEANAFLAKAAALSSALAAHSLTLTVSAPASLKPASSLQ